VYRAASSNFQKTLALVFIEIAFQVNLALDLVEHSLFGLAILTVFGMDSIVAQFYLDTLKVPSFPLRIHAECDRGSGAQGGQQIVIGPGSAVGTADGFGFVREEFVLSGFNRLGKAFFRNRAYSYYRSHAILLFAFISIQSPVDSITNFG
jgi:hypothetical protein